MEMKEIELDNKIYPDYNTNEVLYKLKKYAEKHSAIFMFLLTAVVTVISYLVRISFYAYKIGYNQFFNISSRYINISENSLYEFSLYVAVSIILLGLNGLAQNFLEQRKLSKYFFGFTIILICIMVVFSLVEDFDTFIEDLAINLIIIVVLSIFVVFTLHCFTIVSYFNQSISTKISRLNVLIDQKEKKLEKLQLRSNKINKLLTQMLQSNISKRLEKLQNLKLEKEEELDNIERSRVMNETNNTNKKLKIHPVLTFIFVFAFILIFICGIGYFNASNEQYIKIIPNEFLNIKITEDLYDYAILFENDDIYLICPCEEIEKQELRLISNVQIEVNKKDIIVVKKKYTDIK